MNELQVKILDANTISIEQILSNHRCRFVLDGEQIRLDRVEWGEERPPKDAEDVLETMWAQARRHRLTENRA